MRVLLDCRMAAWSGVGRYTRGLARGLARRTGFDLVQVVGGDVEPPAPDAAWLRARGGVLTPGGSMELGRLVREVAPDVTHCPHYPTPFPTPHPLVVTIHDLGPLLVEGVMPSPLKRAVYRHWNNEALRLADRVIVPSEFTAGTVREFAPAAASCVRVVGEAADDFTAGPSSSLPAAAVGAPYVLSMGNTRAHKDLPTLLHAFSEVARSHPDLRLVLVGEERPGYVAGVIGGDPAAGRVAFSGPVDDPALRALYSGAAVFAFPSRFEGYGLPPLEAMSLGTPVVCAEAASLPEVVGDAALLFAPGDGRELAALLTRVLDEPTLADDLRARGRERARAFTWDAVASATVRVYEEALAAV